MAPKHIVVIGAGVIGLQTALTLLEAGYDVTIMAKHFPSVTAPEYTSPWAGGQWRSHASSKDEEQRNWDLRTLRKWFELIQSEERTGATKRCGLALFESIEYSSVPERPWYSPFMKSFTELESKELPNGFSSGCKYISVAIDVPAYLDFLFGSCEQNGALTLETTLSKSTSMRETLLQAKDVIKDKFAGTTRETVSAFVNATGISAGELVPDENVFPIRGQTVMVQGVATRITTAHFPTSGLKPTDPQITYVIPRSVSGTTILGGTKQVGNWETTPNPETTEKIINTAKQYTPELLDEYGEYKVLGVKVGLRPGRKGGARLEAERLGDILVCHAYGNAGGGYQNSIGFAEKVVELLKESL